MVPPDVPIDLRRILNDYNLKAYTVSFKRPDVAGAFDRANNNIYVNQFDHPTRQCFTVAHELGHYFLHRNVNSDILYREKSNSDSDIEKEANEFAAELLMPESAIRAYWPIADSIQNLANIFGVSYLAMKTRLQYLGFI